MARGRTLSPCLAAVVLLALCLLAACGLAAEEGPHKSPVVECGEDFHAICSSVTSARELWGCMMKNSDRIENDVCREYVIGFRACTRDAEKRGTCVYPAADYATSVRRCLRKTPEKEISAECLSSTFYHPIAELRRAKEGQYW